MHQTNSLKRRGTAPLEFALYLPVFAGFAITLAVIFQVHSGVLRAQIETTSELALKRTLSADEMNASSQVWPAPDSEVNQALLSAFESDENWNRGLVEVNATKPTSDGLGFFSPFADAQHKQIELADDWSDRLVFADSSDRHPPLELPEQIRFYDENFNGFDEFQGLVQGGELGGNTDSQAAFREAYAVANHRLPSVLRSIQNELGQVANDLAAERAKERPNQRRIADLAKKQKRLRKSLEQLQAVAGM